MSKPKIVAIVQARMGSSRLPGKVLLPCLGKPMLAYQIDRLRKVEKVDQIVIASSTNEGDDVIENFCQQYGVAIFRGSEDDVLTRYAEAAKEYNADVVVRLTADCPLIDPDCIDQVISKYLEISGPRVYVSNTLDRTYPRGMDTEAFSIELLKWVNINAVAASDREHVTPMITRNDQDDIIKVNVTSVHNFSAYRFTLDYQKDYFQIVRLIESNLPNFSVYSLMKRAKILKLNFHDNAEVESYGQGHGHGTNLLSCFGLGAAQFGMYYGRFNRDGVPSIESTRKILKRANEYGMSIIDTAYQYGESESIIGQCREELSSLEVITKTPIFSDEIILDSDAMSLRNAFDNSLHSMQLSKIHGLLIHHASNLLAPGGERLYEEMLKIKSEGLVKIIGVSAYSGEIIERIQEKFPIDVAQLPINILDRRLLTSGALERLTESGIQIHARSAFLQGLLLTDPLTLATQFDSVRETLIDFHAACRNSGIKPAHAALHYLLAIPGISKVIVGVESLSQFDDIFMNFPEQINFDYENFICDNIEILNPVLWGN